MDYSNGVMQAAQAATPATTTTGRLTTSSRHPIVHLEVFIAGDERGVQPAVHRSERILMLRACGEQAGSGVWGTRSGEG